VHTSLENKIEDLFFISFVKHLNIYKKKKNTIPLERRCLFERLAKSGMHSLHEKWRTSCIF